MPVLTRVPAMTSIRAVSNVFTAAPMVDSTHPPLHGSDDTSDLGCLGRRGTLDCYGVFDETGKPRRLIDELCQTATDRMTEHHFQSEISPEKTIKSIQMRWRDRRPLQRVLLRGKMRTIVWMTRTLHTTFGPPGSITGTGQPSHNRDAVAARFFQQASQQAVEFPISSVRPASARSGLRDILARLSQIATTSTWAGVGMRQAWGCLRDQRLNELTCQLRATTRYPLGDQRRQCFEINEKTCVNAPLRMGLPQR